MNTDLNTPETFDIPAPRFAELEKRVERLARRADKLGQAAVAVKVVGEKTVPVKDESGRPTGQVRVFKVVEIIGSAPTVAGYTFVAAVEHTKAGNIISKAPDCQDVEVPTDLRDGKPTCDHCNTRRARKDTFILRKDEDSSLIRVGRNCLADFLRGEDAAEALRLFSLIHDVRRFASMSEEEGFGGVGGGYLMSLCHFVACAFRAVAVKGWISRGQVYDDQSGEATATTASYAADQCPQSRSDREYWESLQPTDAECEDAKKAIEWAKGLDGRNDYEHNLKVACSLEYIESKNMGLAASITVAFHRFQEREIEQAREAKKTADSTHFGTVDSRYVRKLTVTKAYNRESDYGLTVLYTLEDETGNVFKWWASGGCYLGDETRPMKPGDELFFTFAVKRHGEYRDIQETTITRARLSKEAPSHKWVGTDGEIFKTKKAMKAVTPEAA